MACQTPPPGGRDAPPAPGITGAAAEIRHLVTRSRPLLGTFVVIAVAGTDRLRLNAAITDALAEIERVDAVMSVHRPDSELSRLNARAAHEPVVVSEELFRLIARAQEIAVATDGSFDVTIWPLTDLWGFLWKEHRLPSAEELRQTLPRVSFRLLSLDAATRTVHFRRRGMSLDLGGIAKGFAVDCAIEKLKSLGVTNALVRAGGDLRAIGDAPGQAGWLVQLEDPGKQGRRTSVRLREAAISTSGNYENYFEVGGRRYSHLLDPRTGMPVEGIAACSVMAPTCVESDAWATACFVLGIPLSLSRFGEHLAIRFTVMPQREGAPPIVQESPAWSRWTAAAPRLQ